MVHLVKLLSRSPLETMEIGAKMGRHLSAGDVVALTGILGSGKSILARGILRALGAGDHAPSPSFIIVASYEGRLPVNHIDLFRLRTVDEAMALGIEDLLYSEAVNVIEWAERIKDILPPSRIEVVMGVRDEPDERLITILPSDERMKQKLLPLLQELVQWGYDENPRD